MAAYRLARRAAADLADILETSTKRWGSASKRRYEARLIAAMRLVAANPIGPTTRDRADIAPGMRSFHIRHARARSAGAKVKHPVHVLFYRVVAPGEVQIVRILHERMDPRHNLLDT